MLTAFEAAMRQGSPLPGHQAAISEAQIVLGLDPKQLREAVSSEDATDAYWYNDARLSSIRASLGALDISDTGRGQTGGGDFKTSPVGKPHAAVIEEVAQHIVKRCSSILMVPEETFDIDNKSVASYGLDSMIGAELRSWLFKEFGLDIGFQTLFGQTLNFTALANMVAEEPGL
jgi:acyl carrier protein